MNSVNVRRKEGRRRYEEERRMKGARGESAGSAVELFIILSPCDCDLWAPLWKRREMRGEDKVGLAEAEIDGVIREERQEVRKHQRMGMIASCAVQMSDCVQASHCRPLGGSQPGEAHRRHGESSCTQVLGSADRSPDVGQTNRQSAVFKHGPPVYFVLVYLLSVYVLFSVCLPWQPLFCMVIIFFIFKHLADAAPRGTMDPRHNEHLYVTVTTYFRTSFT